MDTIKANFGLIAGIALFVILFAIPTTGFSQQSKAETKKERKDREKQEQLKRYEAAKQLVMDTNFVVRAETIQFKDGGMMNPVQSTINFLKMDGSEAVLQVGSDFARTSGLNNLGGVTLKGKISNIKISEKENKNRLFMTFTLTGLVGTARIAMTLAGSEKAMIDVDGMFSGRALSMRGPVQPIKGANIFEGTEF